MALCSVCLQGFIKHMSAAPNFHIRDVKIWLCHTDLYYMPIWFYIYKTDSSFVYLESWNRNLQYGSQKGSEPIQCLCLPTSSQHLKGFFHWRSLILVCEQIEELYQERFKFEVSLQATVLGSWFRSCLPFSTFYAWIGETTPPPQPLWLCSQRVSRQSDIQPILCPIY